MDTTKIWKRYDFSFFGATTLIFLVGVVNLYSATHAEVKDFLVNLWRSQIIWYFVAMGFGAIASFVRPENLFRISYSAYAFNVLLLVLVLIIGDVALGGQRWLEIGPIRFQPSELMKLSLILALARWFSRTDPHLELSLKALIVPCLITLIPSLLIMAQPDLGTGMICVLIFAWLVFYRRLRWKTIGVLALVGVLSGVFMYNFGLKEYQKKRIHTFIDPSADQKGSGYNAIQSKIAIGSGQIFGKGYKKSSQASLSYLPENHTDFVFSVYNEEHGLFGSAVLISLYIFLFFKYVRLASSVNKFFDGILAIGILGMFFWHTVINMSMVMGLMPIVGIPLPLMSYGGTSLITFGVCTGVATAISNSRTIFSS